MVQAGLIHTKEVYMTKNIPNFVARCPENYYYENNEWWYCGAKSRKENERQRAVTHHNKNKNRMWVDGQYIPTSHPLHKPGRYKGFEEAAFSALQNYKSSKEGEVYIITNPAFEGWVKVGMAVDAMDRLKGYQTSSPFRDYELQFFCKVNNRRASESQAHQILASKFNQQGEWFQCSIEEARQVINQVKLESE